MQLSISIVSYNTKDLLRRCLASIFKFTKNLSFEVIVVENNSSDGSGAMVERKFPRARLIKNRVNKWYTGANNQALKICRGKYFMILNSDTFFSDNSLKLMVDYLESHPDVGAVEPRQEDEAGQVAQTSSRHNSWWLDLIELTLLHRLFKPKALAKFRLAGVNRKTTYPAEVISDGAMLVRTAVFKKIGGYDTRFKLYYTENDLCRRLQGLSLKAIHLGKAMVKHRISASTDKAGWKIISGVYAGDARQYYSKYQSAASGNLIYWLLQFNNLIIRYKSVWPWLSLVGLATVLRFYRLPEYMTFIGDQGRDYLAARDMALTGVWPLVGIPSSIPWLHQGSLFIWLTALMLKLGNFNPVTPAILTAVLGVISVYLLYRLSRSWWAGLVLATAPLSVIHSRLPYHLSPIPLVAIGYLWALTINSAGWGIFFTALLLQFELSNLPLVFLLLFWFRRRWRELLYWLPVGLIPFIPKIIYDFSHGFSQTVGLAAWTGYRLTRVGEYGNATANIFDFWTKFAAPGYPWLAAVIGVWLGLTLFKQSKLLILTLGFILVGFFVHGSPSEGYFLVLFPVWAWLLGGNRRVALILALINIFGLFANNFYTYGPNLRQRLQLVDRLPDNFRLENYSQNPGWASYLDNYRYLLKWQGKDYQDESGIIYTIYDGSAADFNQPRGTTVFNYAGQKLIKYDY